MMNKAFFSFAAGIMLVSILPELLSFWHIAILISFAIFIIAPSYILKTKSIKIQFVKNSVPQFIRFNAKFANLLFAWSVSLLPAFLCGILWGTLWGYWHLSTQLPEALNNQKVWLSGSVAKVHSQINKPLKIQLEVIHLDGESSTPIKRVMLNWYETRFIPESGDQLRVKAKIKRIHGRLNPNSFDYHTWLFAQGIDATGYVIADPANQRTGDSQLNLFEKLRQAIDEIHNRFSNQRDYKAITQALITGDKDNFSESQWNLFRQTGTMHLIVISGLHIGLLSWLAFHLLSRCIRLTGLGMPRYRADFWAAIGSALTAFGYAGLAGFTIPSLRAMVMVWALLSGMIFAYPINYQTRFLLALALVLAVDPLAFYSPGFWLSFGIIAIILVYTKARLYQSVSDRRSKIKDFVLLQGFIFISITPWLALYFKQVSLIAPLANLFAIPYVSFILVPADFFVSLFALITQHISWLEQINFWLFQLLGNLTGLFVTLLHGFHAIPFASLNLPYADLAWVLLLIIAALCLFFPIKNLVYPGLLCVLVLLLPRTPLLKSGEFSIGFIDTGQSLSVLVKTRSHSLLYDAGPRFNRNYFVQNGAYGKQGYRNDGLFSAMQADSLIDTAILPSMQHYAIHQPDKVIISHDNQDHSGGLPHLLIRGLVKHLHAPPEVLMQFFYLIPRKEECIAGMEWSWDQVTFRVIHPHAFNMYSKINNRSCVIQITSPYGSALLTGDIQKQAEKQLIQNALVYPLQSQLLLVPHHGSKTSSTPNFIQTVNPEYAVISVGYQNRFQHPHSQVLKLYEQSGITLKRTDRDGLVNFTFTHEGIKLSSQREKQPKYWFP